LISNKNKEVVMKGMTLTKAEETKENCVTEVFDWCPKCLKYGSMEIFENNNEVLARCKNCGHQFQIHLNVKKYFEEYLRKGGKS
jgi:Zn ribbon nucleic-acid-binding protein